MAIRQVALVINCGYARVSIFDNSNPEERGRYARQIDTRQRATKFREQFGSIFGLTEPYFKVSDKKSTSQFDRDSKKVMDGFNGKFPVKTGRVTYVKTFSHSKWGELSLEEKKKHSLSNCARCFELHRDIQESFPLKPFYQPKPKVVIDHEALQKLGVKQFTSGLISELNQVYEDEASTSFTDALVQSKSSGLEKKRSRNEKRKEKIKIQKDVVKSVNKQFSETAAISMLSRGESKSQFHRKRMDQSFESPQPAKKFKSHSPDFSKVPWDKEKLRECIENWTPNTPINWSQVARDHGIPGMNGGQVVKEFTAQQNIDTSHISTPKRRPTLRPRKRKLPGGEVSIPCNPPIKDIEATIRSMISAGKFTLGEECSPYTISKYTMVDDVLTPHEVEIPGRKVPLIEIRQKLLDNQQKYMRLTPESTIASMTRQELLERLKLKCDDKSDEELRKLLSEAEKSRFICMWHDHATILKRGFFMITAHVMYDPVVFYTDTEYQELNPGTTVNIQAEVEQPKIHLLALGSSSVEDQAAVTGDRLSCILDLSEPVKTEQGIEISDTLRYFSGDHPATQFEQGTNQGGHYKCAVCGTHEHLFDDQAHTLQHKWRDVKELQAVATSGKHGKTPMALTPFKLRVKELRSELEARGFFLHEKMLRPELESLLKEVLKGVARVPALLLTDPTKPLASINLDRYEILACEPLHDIKGHIANLIIELPHILPVGETKLKCTDLIDKCLAKDKKTGADFRKIIIKLYLRLKDTECSSRILLLLHSIIKISEIAYSRDNKRCPRQLLQCYSMCWMHMELLKDLFPSLKETSKSKFFGHYVHALTAHMPTQLELACQRSVNAESQERLFGQGRKVAEDCTNHHAENVIPQIMLRMQAKQEVREIIGQVNKAESVVAEAAKDMPRLPGTKIKSTFIKQREDSWQVHLQRISPFLIEGEGVWWSRTPSGFLFHDGDTDPANPNEVFSLFHHRYHSVNDVELRRDVCWKKIVDEKIVLPAHTIKLYDADGNQSGRLLYNDHSVTCECDQVDSPSIEEELLEPPLAQAPASSDSESSAKSTESVVNDSVPASSDSESSAASTECASATAPSTSAADEICDTCADSSSTCVEDTAYLTVSFEEHEEGLKTTVANSIKHLIGFSDDLAKFDDLRFKLKKAKRAGRDPLHMSSNISEYTELVKNIKHKLMLFKSEKSAMLKDLEKAHYQKHNALPAKTRGSQYYNLLKEKNLAVCILRSID